MKPTKEGWHWEGNLIVYVQCRGNTDELGFYDSWEDWVSVDDEDQTEWGEEVLPDGTRGKLKALGRYDGYKEGPYGTLYNNGVRATLKRINEIVSPTPVPPTPPEPDIVEEAEDFKGQI